MKYIIDHETFQANCFWFEPKVLCKHPDGNSVCNLDFCPVLKGREIIKEITALDIMGMKNILFKMSRRVQSGQFDSRSFVGDVALELRSLLFENEKSFWKEYDEWELKQK